MNLWNSSTGDNSSMMEAFMSSDLPSFWPPSMQIPSTPPPATLPSSSSISISNPPKTTPYFSQETLQQRLQALIDGAPESWTYAIFWQSSVMEYAGQSLTLLGWGDGYYRGEEDKVKSRTSPRRRSPTYIAEQEHRKRILRQLNSLVATTADDPVDEEVTDTEWFFLISMTQSFVNGSGLPGQAFYSSAPIWLAGADRLLGSQCERARQAHGFGLRTIVCVPSANGVVELGSTESILQSSSILGKVRVLFSFNSSEELGSGSGSWAAQPENDPSALWLTDPVVDCQEPIGD